MKQILDRRNLSHFDNTDYQQSDVADNRLHSWSAHFTISDELIAIPDFIFVIAFETVSSVLK